MENNKQKIAILAIVVMMIVGVIGTTIAYFNGEALFRNEFKTPSHESEFTEEFTSPDNWLPGDEEKKEVFVTNTGEYDIAVRISYTEEWIGADGVTQLPLVQDQNGTDVTAAIINFPNKEDWGRRTEDDGVTYYYYKDILGKDESTSLFMDKVIFNKDIKHDENCTNIYTYSDDTTSSGNAPEEGKTVKSTTKRCESTGQTYAGGTYILTIKIETIQWDQYKNGWGLDEELGDLMWDTPLESIIKKSAIIDNVASTYVVAPTGIDFSNISSSTNGNGVYLRAGTENNENPIYYYRGNVNNNIIFAGFCWKIVRTTETGGVKLLYNGVVTSGNTCNNQTGAATQIGNSTFNAVTSKAEAKYLGYMYDTTVSSEIKSIVDNWYKTNILSQYDEYLEDTVWCNDRSVSGTSGNYTYYGAYGRLRNNSNPSVTCANQADRYTLKSTDGNYDASLNGNKLLDYPIGLLTADEANLAGGKPYGGVGTSNSNYYLFNGLFYWLMSPGNIYNSTYPTSWGSIISNGGALIVGGTAINDYNIICFANNNNGVRPAVSLKPGMKIESGDGTPTKPYTIVES